MLEKSKKFLQAKLFKIVTIVTIIILPSIYGVIFLGSMWDPYGNVDKLPVAIVNNDKIVTYNGKELKIGNQLVENLKEKKSMAFEFVDEEHAQKGLKNEEYYMVITIPADFSENASTLMSDDPQRMQLKYQTNPGVNYTATKMSESAAQSIKNSIANTVTKSYVAALLDNLVSVGDGMQKAADGSNKLYNGISSVSEGSKEISSNIKLLEEGTLSFKNGAETLEKGLIDYTAGVATVNNGSTKLNEGLSQFSNVAKDLSNATSKLLSGSDNLKNGIRAYTDGVNKVYSGASQIDSNSAALITGISSISESASKLSDGSSQVLKGMQQMSNQLSSSTDTSNQQQIQQIVLGIEQLNEGIQQLNKSLQSNNVDTASIKQSVATIATNSNALLPKVNTAVKSLVNGLVSVKNSLDSKTSQMGLINGMEALNGGLIQLNNGINGEGGFQQGLELYSQGASNLSAGLKTLADTSSTLNTGADSLYSGIFEVNKNMPNIVDALNQLTTGANALSNGTTELVSNNSTLLDGISQLTNGSSKLNKGVNSFSKGYTSLDNGISDVQDGAKTLSTSLQKGAKDLNSIHSSDANVDVIAKPIDLEENQFSTIDKNGDGMAAYMMSIALWISCLAFASTFKVEDLLKRSKLKNRSNLISWFSVLVKTSMFSVIQSVILVVALREIHGFNPDSIIKTIFVGFLASLAFLSIQYLVNMIFGTSASLLLLIFLVVQLSAAGGAYPIQLSNSFYGAVHPYMPITYSIHAFRTSIAQIGSGGPDFIVLTSIFLVCSILIYTLLTINSRKHKGSVGQEEKDIELNVTNSSISY